jgi:hypothetical protein
MLLSIEWSLDTHTSDARLQSEHAILLDWFNALQSLHSTEGRDMIALVYFCLCNLECLKQAMTLNFEVFGKDLMIGFCERKRVVKETGFCMRPEELKSQDDSTQFQVMQLSH